MNAKSIGIVLLIIGIALILIGKKGISHMESREMNDHEYNEALKAKDNIFYGGIGVLVIGGISLAIGFSNKRT